MFLLQTTCKKPDIKYSKKFPKEKLYQLKKICI